MILGVMGIGSQELILIVFAALLLFGGKKIPEMMRGLGKGVREFKRGQEADPEPEEQAAKRENDTGQTCE